jgi:hypothetical protein
MQGIATYEKNKIQFFVFIFNFNTNFMVLEFFMGLHILEVRIHQIFAVRCLGNREFSSVGTFQLPSMVP